MGEEKEEQAEEPTLEAGCCPACGDDWCPDEESDCTNRFHGPRRQQCGCVREPGRWGTHLVAACTAHEHLISRPRAPRAASPLEPGVLKVARRMEEYRQGAEMMPIVPADVATLREAADALASLRAEVAQLREVRDRFRAALADIAAMSEYDQIDAHRLCDHARRALTPTGGDHE